MTDTIEIPRWASPPTMWRDQEVIPQDRLKWFWETSSRVGLDLPIRSGFGESFKLLRGLSEQELMELEYIFWSLTAKLTRVVWRTLGKTRFGCLVLNGMFYEWQDDTTRMLGAFSAYQVSAGRVVYEAALRHPMQALMSTPFDLDSDWFEKTGYGQDFWPDMCWLETTRSSVSDGSPGAEWI